MNSLLPRRSAESACLFCRQGLVRQWRQQQQRQHLFGRNNSTASVSSPSPSIQPLFASSQQRRRYLSGTAAAQRPPPPFAQPAESSSASTADAASTSASKTTTTPYTRYSLYTEPATPMTMRPPPPPTPVVDIDSPEMPAKPAKQAEATQTPSPTQKAAPTEQKTEPAPKTTAAAAPSTPSTAGSPPAAPPKKRASRLRTPRKAAMKLTPAAVEQVRELLEGPEPKLLKIGVRNRGCSGLAYNLEYVEKPGAFDEMVEQDGVRVLVDSKALFSIIGSEMDWVEDKLNQRFVFRNPNIKEECGCGESFMV
ncbi:Iron-sulfur assembly protein 1 [Sporothrix eucalyptigena]